MSMAYKPGDFEPTKLAGKVSGTPNTLEYRVNFSHKSKKISPWYGSSPDTHVSALHFLALLRVPTTSFTLLTRRLPCHKKKVQKKKK